MARQKEFDREEVLDRALRLFQCKGYEAASLQDLTEATGLSRSSLYDTFADKRALYIAALEHYIERQSGFIRRSLQQPGSKTEAIRLLFTHLTDEILTDREGGCLVVDASAELASRCPDIAAVVERTLERNIQAFYEAIREAQHQGEIGQERDAYALASFLLNTIHGLRITGRATQDRQLMDRIVQVALSTLYL